MNYNLEEHQNLCDIETQKKRKLDKWLASTIFVWNILMLAGNLVATVMSRSYSVVR